MTFRYTVDGGGKSSFITFLTLSYWSVQFRHSFFLKGKKKKKIPKCVELRLYQDLRFHITIGQHPGMEKTYNSEC